MQILLCLTKVQFLESIFVKTIFRLYRNSTSYKGEPYRVHEYSWIYENRTNNQQVYNKRQKSQSEVLLFRIIQFKSYSILSITSDIRYYNEYFIRSSQGRIEDVRSKSSTKITFPIEVKFPKRYNQNNRRKRAFELIEQKLVTSKCSDKANCVFVQTLAAAKAHHCRFCSSAGLTLEHGCAFDGRWGNGHL